MITHLEPAILEWELEWVLGSITMNKASGGDGIPVELFQILKDGAVKGLHAICQQIGKTQQWTQDWRRSVFIPIPKKGNTKECSNYHTIVLISHLSNVQNSPSQASTVHEPWTSRFSFSTGDTMPKGLKMGSWGSGLIDITMIWGGGAEFLGSPVVRTLHPCSWGPGFHTWSRN